MQTPHHHGVVADLDDVPSTTQSPKALDLGHEQIHLPFVFCGLHLEDGACKKMGSVPRTHPSMANKTPPSREKYPSSIGGGFTH